MPATAIVWLRRDLRVHDHPGLAAAARSCDRVVPVFVLDRRLLARPLPVAGAGGVPAGVPRGAARARCAPAAPASCCARARRRRRCPRWRARSGASRVYFASRRVAVRDRPRPPRRRGARRGRRGGPARARQLRRRRRPAADARRPAVHGLLARSGGCGSGSSGARCTARRGRCALPAGVRARRDPVARARSASSRARATRSRPARRPAASACTRSSRDGLAALRRRHDRLAGGTSELSPYLHFGCLSARELEERVRERGGRARGAYIRQLALARLLRPRAPAPSRQRPPRVPGALREAPWDDDEEALGRGRRAARASRSWTPRCASCGPAGGCTTAPG